MSRCAHVGTRARQKIARREAILAAAEKALGADGEASVDSIAIDAQVAKGTVYNYFPDRQSLVEAVTQTVDARLMGEINANLPSAASPARLAFVLCALLKLAIDDPGAAAIIGRRMGEGARQGEAVVRAIWIELRTIAYSGAMNGEEAAAVSLVLSAMRAAMQEIADVPVARRRARAYATVVLCLRAVGAAGDATEAVVEAAMDSLAPPRRFSRQDRERPSTAH
jgi:AcrR family transcriptional regulator